MTDPLDPSSSGALDDRTDDGAAVGSSGTAQRTAATPRPVVLAWVVVAIAAVGLLVGLAAWLRMPSPAAGPPTPALAEEGEWLRTPPECAVPERREGAVPPPPAVPPDAPPPPVTGTVEQVTSNELYDCPSTWDTRTVRYVGEAVGAVLTRGDHAWVQLNDDVYADGVGPVPGHRDFRGGNAGIGARLVPAQAARITGLGGPTQRGDLVEVVAVFHRVHPQSGEVAVLDVASLRVLRRATPLDRPSAGPRAPVAAVAAVAALAVTVLERRRRTS